MSEGQTQEQDQPETTAAAPAFDPKTGEIPMTPADLRKQQERSFSHLLQQIEGGSLHEDLSVAVHHIIAELAERKRVTGQNSAGKLTLVLDFKLDDRMVDVIPDFKIKLPEDKRGRSVFFVTPENRLSASDPRQKTFQFGTVVKGRGE